MSAATPQPVPNAPPAVPVTVRAWPSQTAVWVGDRFSYVIEFDCAPNVDVLQEDLAKDKLRVDGLEVLATNEAVIPRPDGGSTRRVEYELASYRVDTPAVSIADLTVRYYFTRGNMRPEDIRPAGEVRVPPATIALRSTIPDAGEVTAIRDVRAAPARARWTGALPLAGLALLLVAVAPAAWWAVDRVRRARPARPRDSARKRRSEHRAAFDDIRVIDPASVGELRDAYTRLDALVRDHVGRTYKVPAAALTPAEIEGAVGPAGPLGNDDRARTIADLLRECERARFAPAEAVPAKEAWRRAIETAGTIVGLQPR